VHKLAPIALFVYNRPQHTLQTLEALAANDLAKESVLYVFADGAKSSATEADRQRIEETRQVVQSKRWCKEVIVKAQTTNQGLANSIINGVTKLLERHDTVIVLEDDLVTASGFLAYMNEALSRYANHEQVMQVSGYNFPLQKKANNESYFLPLITSWGWGTWARAWKKFDPMATGYEVLKTNSQLQYQFNLNGSYPYTNMLFAQMEEKTIDSWAIRWWWSVFKEKGITLYPDCSLIKNIGVGQDATHTSTTSFPINESEFSKNLNYTITKFPFEILANLEKFQIVIAFLKLNDGKKVKYSSISNTVIQKLKSILKKLSN
jgi:hypothetical protein